VPKMNTMRIATPLGYSSRPPRRVWPIVLVAGLLLGLGGGAFAVAWFGRKGEAGAVAEAGTASGSIVVAPAGSGSGAVTPVHADAAVAPAPADAAVATAKLDAAAVAAAVDAAVPRPDAAVRTPDAAVGALPAAGMAIVVIDSAPQGAEVYGPDKKSLGRTPARLTLPISSAPLELELRLPGYRRKSRALVVSGNTVINVPLERAPVVVPPSGSGTHKGSGHHNSGDDLERPE